MLFCICFRYIAEWLDNYIFYKVFSLYFQGRNNTYTAQLALWLLQYYWLYFLCCTLRPHDCFVTTNLYFSIPSLFHSVLKPPLLTTISLFSVSRSLFLFHSFILFFRFHISEMIWYLSFSDWLISFNIIPARSTHAITNGKILFFFMAD